jgi:hypothetical protein
MSQSLSSAAETLCCSSSVASAFRIRHVEEIICGVNWDNTRPASGPRSHLFFRDFSFVVLTRLLEPPPTVLIINLLFKNSESREELQV